MENKGIEMSLEELLEFIRESGDNVMVSFTVEKEGEDGQ